MIGWLPVAVAAQGILGSAAVFDKLLLKKRSIDAWSYTFWFGILGGFAVLLLPFGFQATSLQVILLGIIAGVFFIASTFFLFAVLDKIEASETLPLIGSLSPIFTLLFSWLFLNTRLGIFDILGFLFLVATGFLLFFVEKKDFSARVLFYILGSSMFLAASHVASKIVFGQTSFITGFFWIKVGGVLFALSVLLSRRLRKDILEKSEHTAASNRWLYFLNRGYASLGSLFISGAIFLSEPALVDATQNLRYVIIFVLAWFVLRERFRGKVLAGKIVAAVLITIGLGWLTLGEYARNLPAVIEDRPIAWGVTFSDKFSSQLGLDWRNNFDAILTELKPKKLRLIAYWDEIERERGIYDFSVLDWQLERVGRSDPRPDVVLVMGLKTPRWPECHIPEWALGLTVEEREAALRKHLGAVVKQYRKNDAIKMWQIENEPYLMFGKCQRRGADFLEQEVNLVRSLDPSRRILMTDGGEFGLWAVVAKYGDVFGTTMYRKAYPTLIGPLFGVIEYPITPNYFRLKEQITRSIIPNPKQPFLVIELQGEPWSPKHLNETPYERQLEIFSPKYFRETIEYAKATGFEEYYLWGAEWWYWVKTAQGHPEYWDIGKSVLK
ncbi:MAG: DMT family transporter [Candidatus Sungbacteria bacterium]|uniref:DMT family transporter n=1 Tax=Candidatus Sungiibacteriota bacterium TaxID=2750080 RepID=A0A931SBE9_9BACT|nr:DMT family transporter [Candidatus Sungbacteria bacterium]